MIVVRNPVISLLVYELDQSVSETIRLFSKENRSERDHIDISPILPIDCPNEIILNIYNVEPCMTAGLLNYSLFIS